MEDVQEAADAAKARVKEGAARGWRAIRRGSANILRSGLDGLSDLKDSVWKDDAF